jgi:hypothetical protein
MVWLGGPRRKSGRTEPLVAAVILVLAVAAMAVIMVLMIAGYR